MSGRISPLSPRALVLSLLVPFLLADCAYAHRLNADAFMLPNRKIQVESWFSSGDAPKGAKVQVFRAGGQLLTEGQLNDQGIFVFTYGDAEQIRVVISAGAGHRKELSISATVLAQAAATREKENDSAAQTKEVSSVPVPLAEHSSGGSVKDVLVGVGFLLALAAFVLSLRNARQLRALKRANEGAMEQRSGTHNN